jgi:glucan endo-1,3-alpha-glucosidase
VQIITWNDYGESSYICDTNASQIVGGAEKYVRQYDHGGFRAMLPYFIRAYKAGTGAISLPHEDRVVAWYRTMPVGCGSDGGTVWGQGGRQSAAHGARDVVSVVALTNGMRSVSVDIGGSREVFHTRGDYPVTYFEVPFRGRCGPVTVGIEGRSKTGPAIEDVCPPCGHVSLVLFLRLSGVMKVVDDVRLSSTVWPSMCDGLCNLLIWQHCRFWTHVT